MKSILTATYVLGVLAALCLSHATAATTQELTSKATSAPLSVDECKQLAGALLDSSQWETWPQISTALQSNALQADLPTVAKSFYDTWVGNSQNLSALNFDKTLSVWSSLRAMVRDDLKDQMMPAWMAASGQWKQVDAPSLYNLAMCLSMSQDKSAATTAAKASVAGHAWDGFLSKSTLLDQGLRQHYMGLARYSGPTLTADQKNTVVNLIVKAYSPDAAVAEWVPAFKDLTIEAISDVAGTLAALGSPDKGAAKISDWMAVNQTWKTAKPSEIMQLTWTFDQIGKAADAGTIITNWASSSESYKTAKFSELAAMTRLLIKTAKTDAEKQNVSTWAMRAYSAGLVEGATDCQVLKVLAGLMWDAGLTGKGKGYPDFAAVLVNLLKRGDLGPYPSHGSLAFMLGTDETRAMVMAVLVDEKGIVRQDAAAIMSAASAIYDARDNWRAYLDNRIADKSITGDQKAGWLIARACFEIEGTQEPTPMVGKAWMEQALTQSASEPMKLKCLEWLAMAYAKSLQDVQAKSLVNSLAGQFKEASSISMLADLRSRIDQTATAARAERNTEEEAAKKNARESYLAEIHRRLAVAKASGNQSAANRYQAILQAQNQ